MSNVASFAPTKRKRRRIGDRRLFPGFGEPRYRRRVFFLGFLAAAFFLAGLAFRAGFFLGFAAFFGAFFLGLAALRAGLDFGAGLGAGDGGASGVTSGISTEGCEGVPTISAS